MESHLRGRDAVAADSEFGAEAQFRKAMLRDIDLSVRAKWVGKIGFICGRFG